MVKLEDLQPGMRIRGLVRNQIVTLVTVKPISSDAVEVDYRWGDDASDHEYLFRDVEDRLQIVKDEQMWPFDADGKLLRLVSEAYRIDLSHFFDPLLAVHTSDIEPLPHQITAVYEEMLTRQPLRFLLADDPGAGKTIMAGLLIRELMVRGDVQRCLICVPGNLTEQWYDELRTKFRLRFTIFTRDMIKASPGVNPFEEHNQMIVRLDQAKKEDIQGLLGQTNWDLIVCDEAHKMSASFSGGEVSRTQRYRLGELLGKITRHFLLMTATPHNGKDEDFQLFLKLLDVDRFKDISDLMRRVVKEDLLTFEDKRLFPERWAYTSNYKLSPEESDLYEKVTKYVCEEFNRADKLKKGKNTVGFALTILQRRLASSPEAIYQSLKSRRQRLEERLEKTIMPVYDEENFEDLPASEREEQEDELIDEATAARNREELEEEIDILRDLESQADNVRLSGNDKKWNELCDVLNAPEMKNDDGTQRKLVIFTEHLATLNYLIEKLNTLFGHPDAIVKIHGGIRRDERHKVEGNFRNDPNVLILVATDAAGEGINLQCANLIVNYDLPWNPNRLEQRFGRIHRIGQTQECHLWNLVADETREGAVYHCLLEKLKTANNALNGKVFDVLGKLFPGASLREILVKAIRSDNSSALQEVDNITDQAHMLDILGNQALAIHTIDTSKIMQTQEKMKQAQAERLQPWHIKDFFLQALELLRGEVFKREGGRYEITKVPQVIRNHAKEEKEIGSVYPEYQRICFEKDHIRLSNQPEATWIHPRYPLLKATISYLLKSQRATTLEHGARLVDRSDNGTELRVLFCLDQSIQNAVPSTISRKVYFVEIDSVEEREAEVATYLDYRPAASEDRRQIKTLLKQDWLKGEKLEKRAIQYANENLVPRYLESESQSQRIKRIKKEVKKREADIQGYLTSLESRLQALQELKEWKEWLESHLQALKELQELQALMEWLESHLQTLQATQEIMEWLKEPQALMKSLESSLQTLKEPLESHLQALQEHKEHKEQLLQQLVSECQISAAAPIVVSAALIIPIGLLQGSEQGVS